MNSPHPIRERDDLDPSARVRLVEQHLALLWDEVWWHQLPWWRRLGYWLQGFRSPITRFYDD
jgi:hypothetical protein